MINISQYLYFLQNCTGFSEKTTKNYTDFKRINECLQSLFPERKDFSLETIEDPAELEAIILQLQKLPLYNEYNEKGKNQYSATISTYLHFLYARRMLFVSKTYSNRIEKKLIDSSRSNIPGEGLPRILNSAIKEALKIDKDLSKLKPEVTNKRLRINRCNFAAELNNAKEIRADKVNLDTIWQFQDKEYCVYNELSAENFSDFISQYNNAYLNKLSIEVENIDGSKIYYLYIFEHTQNIINTSYLPYLTALRTKPFMLLAGISGTGKSRIVRELAFKSCPSYLQDEDGTTPGNYCMIEVKPNWHDSSELLGYYSNIAKQYVFTDFVKFLLKAKLYSDVPFFVCMDEMNLAPLEQYFAEFLSVLETRKQTESGIKTGALVKGHYFKRIKSVNEYDNVQTDADVYTLLEIPITAKQKEELAKTNSLNTDGLTLPENVFVIGTVNIDDTTPQFSRKVLDRAMTIEMNGGELKDMFGHSSDLEYLPEEKVWKIDQFKPKHVNADEVLEEYIDSNGDLDETGIALKTQLADKLDAINQVLKDTPFVVSYRVLNELVIYAGVLLDDGKETEEAINDAVDQITLMKILPRIEGDEDLLGNAKDENNRLCQLIKVVGPKSQAKIKEMNRRLESGFTRFWP